MLGGRGAGDRAVQTRVVVTLTVWTGLASATITITVLHRVTTLMGARRAGMWRRRAGHAWMSHAWPPGCGAAVTVPHPVMVYRGADLAAM